MKDKISTSGGENSRHNLWKVTSISTGELRVMKCYERFDHEDLISELCATRDMTKHPGIMSFDKVIETAAEAFVLCEFLDGKDLMDFYGGGLPEATAQHLFRQLFGAMAHLHDECGVVHNDIKPDNLFVVGAGGPTDALQAKIVDFGMACFPNLATKKAEPGCSPGQPVYAAPELLDERNQRLSGSKMPLATRAMDIFRLGVTLYITLVGAYPWPPLPRPVAAGQAARQLVPADPAAAQKWSALSPECQAFVGRLLAFAVNERPSAAQAQQDAWLA